VGYRCAAAGSTRFGNWGFATQYRRQCIAQIVC